MCVESDQALCLMGTMILNRRDFMALAVFGAVSPGSAAQPLPYKVRFVAGQKQGDTFTAALDIRMDEGWKTYWRVPGGGGVPPQINVMGDNVKSFIIGMPVPQRLKAGEEDINGYKHEVVFPISIESKTAASELNVHLSAFIGVCDEVCIPVPVDARLLLGLPTSTDAALVMRALENVPKRVAQGPIESLTATESGLSFRLNSILRDILVEAGDLYYVRPPSFGIDGLHGTLSLAGNKAASDLKGKTLRITSIDASGIGLEQMLVVQ